MLLFAYCQDNQDGSAAFTAAYGPLGRSFPIPALCTLYIYRHASKGRSTCSVTFWAAGLNTCPPASAAFHPNLYTVQGSGVGGWTRWGGDGGVGRVRCRAGGGRLGRELHVRRQARWHRSLATAGRHRHVPAWDLLQGLCGRSPQSH